MTIEWESPRVIATIVILAAIVSSVTGFEIGYEIARSRPPQIVIQILPSGGPK
jgi:hypothetical protein